MTQKKVDERTEAFFRILVFIVSGLILFVWVHLIVVLAIVNFFIVIFSEKRDKSLAEFSEYFNTEICRFYRYITFMTNERPFPFTDMKKMGKFE